MKTLVRALGGAAALGVAGLGYASLVERNWFALRRFTVPVLAPGSRPLRVLQISDLHLVPRQQRKIEWVRGLAALEPDLVVNTGDNLARDRRRARGAAGHGAAVRRSPASSSLGSNDYYGAGAEEPRPLPHPRACRRRHPAASCCPSTTSAPGMRRRRLGRPRQRPHHAVGGRRAPSGARRHRRRPHPSRPLCRRCPAPPPPPPR